MKLALFVLIVSATTQVLAQTKRDSDPIGRIIDGLQADAKREEFKSRFDQVFGKISTEQAQADRERATVESNARAHEAQIAAANAAQVAREVMAASAQAPAQPLSNCPYSSRPDNEDQSYFSEKKFTGPNGAGSPLVSSVDYRAIAPKATHEFNPTVVIQSGSGWSTKQVTDTLAKTSQIYAQCGIRIGHATVVYATLPFNISDINSVTEMYTAHKMPASSSKPWLFFVNRRTDNPSQDGGGKSMAYTSGTADSTTEGSAWIAHDSLGTKERPSGYASHPELVIGHELAHLLTDGDHQDREPNLLSSSGDKMTPHLTPEECAQMKSNSSLVHKL